jgi:hypothetical protein
MLRAKEMFLHAKVSPALAKAKGIPFLAGGLDKVALKTVATGSSRTSLQPAHFPQVSTV